MIDQAQAALIRQKLLVHDYAEIDDGHVLSGGKRLLEDAPRFLRAVTAWLDSQSRPEEAPGRQK